jgi:hypothetical protein
MPVAEVPDSFRYRISRKVGIARKTIEVPEVMVPLSVRNCVKDTIE